jgi:hypothetical protein
LRVVASIPEAERATTIRIYSGNWKWEWEKRTIRKKLLDTITAYHHDVRDRRPELKPLTPHARLYVQVGSPPRPPACVTPPSGRNARGVTAHRSASRSASSEPAEGPHSSRRAVAAELRSPSPCRCSRRRRRRPRLLEREEPRLASSPCLRSCMRTDTQVSASITSREVLPTARGSRRGPAGLTSSAGLVSGRIAAGVRSLQAGAASSALVPQAAR